MNRRRPCEYYAAQKVMSRFDQLQDLFDGYGIETIPGFSDSNAFLAAEAKRGRILEDFAEYILKRPRTDDDDAQVRHEVAKCLPAIEAAADRAGRGRCQDVSKLLWKVLERNGVYAFLAKGSMIAQMDGLDTLGWQYVQRAGPTVGHWWVVAPPYSVIDVTASRQFVGLGGVPSAVLSEDYLAGYTVKQSDHLTNDAVGVQTLDIRDLQRLADLIGVASWSGHPWSLRYVPSGVMAFDALDLWPDNMDLGMMPVDFVEASAA